MQKINILQQIFETASAAVAIRWVCSRAQDVDGAVPAVSAMT